jgi:hypothetical protein
MELSKREESVVLSQEEAFQTEDYIQSKKFMASHKKKSAQQPIGSTLQSKMEALKAAPSRQNKHTVSALSLHGGSNAKHSIFGNSLAKTTTNKPLHVHKDSAY